jgi:hypothetical protein
MKLVTSTKEELALVVLPQPVEGPCLELGSDPDDVDAPGSFETVHEADCRRVTGPAS